MRYTMILRDIVDARNTIRGIAHRTPLEYSATFSEMVGGDIYLKLENLQRTGAFKIRGALAKLNSLSPEEKGRGVIAASAGNHAQGVALASGLLGVRSTIVMPKWAPVSKVAATKNYGAEVVQTGEAYDDAYQEALNISADTGAMLIPAFDDPYIIAGQGTIGLEILEDLPDADTVVVPVGGGGLISGVAAAIKEQKPGVRLVGVQAEGAASMFLSYKAGQILDLSDVSTIADGIAVKRPGKLTFSYIQQYVDEMVTVSDEDIAGAMLLLIERHKLVAEGAGVASLAAALYKKADFARKKTVLVISGGNIDVNTISRVIERGLVKNGRHLRIKVRVTDRPGGLSKLTGLMAGLGVNIVSIDHDRIQREVPIGIALVILLIEIGDMTQREKIYQKLHSEGYIFETME